MDQATQTDLTRRIFAHLDARTTDVSGDIWINPTSAYTDPARLAAERAVLFRQYPLLLGLSCQVRDPGDYLTDDFSGVPILVARGEDGKLNAFVNLCRHRGARVVDGCGRGAKGFSCPYHAWYYGLDGALATIPDERNFDGIDGSRRALVKLPVEERDGMIWVRPTPGAPIDLDAHLGALVPEFANYGLDGYHHYETRILRQKMNWKLVIDTFLEPYHLGVLHRNTVGSIFFGNLCLFEPFGYNLRETLPRRTITRLRDLPETEWDLITHTAIVYVLFPNTVFVMQADHVETWRVYPEDGRTDRCVMYLDFYIPEPATSDKAKLHWDNNMDLTIRTVQGEDFPTSEGMQAGYAAEVQDAVVYGRNEPALAHFQKSVAAALDGRA